MRSLIILFSLIACSFFLHGQEEVPAVNNKKNTLGVGIYSGPVVAPLNLQIRYERQFADRWHGYSSLDISSESVPRFQAGVLFDALRNKKRSALLRLGMGPVYKWKRSLLWDLHNERLQEDEVSELSVEVFVQFQYYLNPRHSLFTQFNTSSYLRSSPYNPGRNYFISSINLGYNYHF